jgi:hypothetical protein
MTDGYTYETYSTARFFLPEGFYSIEEIEKLLVDMKATKERTGQALKRAIKPLKENNK